MLRTSRASNKRVACQALPNDHTTRLGGAMMHGIRMADAFSCPRGGRAAHHAHATAHRRSARRVLARCALRDGMAIAESVHRHLTHDPS
ncbi:hypothetical protein A8F72_25670 [Burkholderia cenocepacia]|nr:hypothetical protein A8F32_00035 [Burkholderia cenocepacia]ONI93154.1 hypothetical protein A8F53_34655 [Burkholderia cenocepacia]ONJ14911.1 hypothetical protein A8F33_01855 [Burkholderia cenocepacia]ONJ31695.1 hypothetical protein A8F38_15570 [Burkholderia cenocepacia]ONY69524.1 hypothetical protein A8F35_22905 [Burkholderia cenocepacia]